MSEKCKVLGLTFTYAVSLREWYEKGLLDREKRIYEEHLSRAHFDKIVWFTYGIGDEELAEKLYEIGVLDRRIQIVEAPGWARSEIGKLIYSWILPIIRKKNCIELTLIKSNQMGGARVAAAIAKKYQVPFELRTGYTYSMFYDKRLKEGLKASKKIRTIVWKKYYTRMEKRLYNLCDLAVVSSYHDAQYLMEKYKLNGELIKILTNYIDCESFCNKEPIDNRKERFVFVGRLSKQKNLFEVIKAFKEVGYGLDIYGTGEQEEDLRKIIDRDSLDIQLMGKRENHLLPQILNQYKYYVLGSLYEGMPKTLLEAMACGCICFGTKVEGIEEILQLSKSGVLIEKTDADTIAETILNYLNKKEKAETDRQLSMSASKYIVENHSLRGVAQKEWEYINRILKTR